MTDGESNMTPEELAEWEARMRQPLPVTQKKRRYVKPKEWQNMTISPKRGGRTQKPVERPEGCQHHWRLAEPNGALSEGACKLCGVVKLHNNVYVQDQVAASRWGNTYPLTDRTYVR